VILKVYRTVAQRFKAFESKKEMDENVKAHVFASGKKLHKNARAILDTIVRHSCSVYGVSWLGTDSLAEAVQVSEKTVKRAIDRIISLGIGRKEVVEFQGLTLEYFVLNKFDLDLTEEWNEDVDKVSKGQSGENTAVSTLEAVSEEDEPLRNSKTQEPQDQETNNNVREDVKDENNDDTLDASFTPTNVPEQFVSIAKTFFPDAQKIYRLWHVVQSATKKLDVLSVPIDTIVQSFKESVFALKAGRVRKTIECYLYGTLLNKVNLSRRQQSDHVSFISSWLEQDDQSDSLRSQLDFIDSFYGQQGHSFA